jgi:hypothetical protein
MADGVHPFYYLENFRKILAWLRERYEGLLTSPEQQFIAAFGALSVESAALLVRMITRRGDLFRSTHLVYAEIGCPHRAAAALVKAGWVDLQPSLGWGDWQRLFTKAELTRLFDVPVALRHSSKSQLMQYLRATRHPEHALVQWRACCGESVFRLTVAPLCERLRIVFFGNFRQDWSELVLTDLGIYRYESVAIDTHARAFRTRAEIDQFCSLYDCREQCRAGLAPERVLERMPPALPDCEWLELRRVRLLLQIARLLERTGQWPRALDAYRLCNHPSAEIRAARVLERQERWQEAWDVITGLAQEQPSEAVRQSWERLRKRLARRLGEIRAPALGTLQTLRVARRTRPSHPRACAWPTLSIEIPRPAVPVAVEPLAARYLESPEAPAFYVENSLFNSLLGLWCWDALFAPVPGAFFHPFQAAPADLLTGQFCGRRASQLAACRASLESGEYRERMQRTFQEKAGLASPFVAWEVLTPQLLALALECISPEHLRCCFERILADIGAHRTGLPDLIQFFPRERRYRLIEVKGPGDRLQDNQTRWLSFCAAQGIDVALCRVVWSEHRVEGEAHAAAVGP